MHKAAVYIRVSTDEQTELSPESQLREISLYAAQKGLQLCREHIYIDEGISGRKTENRAAFQRMIAAAKHKPPPFDTLLVWKFSRFARNREDSILYKNILRKKCGVSVLSVKEPLAEHDKTSLLLEGIIEVMDEYFSLNLAEDVRRSMLDNHLKGAHQAHPPYGYRVPAKGKGLQIEPEEAAVVEEIFSRYAAGESCYRIARALNEAGLHTRNGVRWYKERIHYIVQNPVYAGYVRWTTKDAHTDKANASPAVTKGLHTPIIPEALWQQAQKRHLLNSTEEKHTQPPHRKSRWSAGLFCCAECGSILHKADRHTYRCSGYHKGLCAQANRLPAAHLEALLTAQLKADLTDDAHRCTFRITPIQQGIYRTQQTALQRLDKKAARLLQLYLDGGISPAGYKEQAVRLQQEKNAIESGTDTPPSVDIAALQKAAQMPFSSLCSNAFTIERLYTACQSILLPCHVDKHTGRLTLYYRLFF